MLDGIGIDPSSFFTNQILSVATSSVKTIVIGGLITLIAKSVRIEPNPDDRMSGFR